MEHKLISDEGEIRVADKQGRCEICVIGEDGVFQVASFGWAEIFRFLFPLIKDIAERYLFGSPHDTPPGLER